MALEQILTAVLLALAVSVQETELLTPAVAPFRSVISKSLAGVIVIVPVRVLESRAAPPARLLFAPSLTTTE